MILSSAAVSGHTGIESVEHDFSLRIDTSRGKGNARGRITTQFANDGGVTIDLTTDQSYPEQTLRQLKRMEFEA